MSAILANSSASASGGMGMFGMIIWHDRLHRFNLCVYLFLYDSSTEEGAEEKRPDAF